MELNSCIISWSGSSHFQVSLMWLKVPSAFLGLEVMNEMFRNCTPTYELWHLTPPDKLLGTTCLNIEYRNAEVTKIILKSKWCLAIS